MAHDEAVALSVFRQEADAVSDGIARPGKRTRRPLEVHGTGGRPIRSEDAPHGLGSARSHQAGKAEDPDLRQLFTWLAEWEVGHLEQLVELEKMLQDDYWADQGFSPM